MSFILSNELYKNSYILASKKAFFYRFCDTGFKNKWTGFWYKTKKFIEYFAFKVNDEWLSPSNCFAFINGEVDATHFYDLKNLKVKEFLFLPENSGSLVCILTFENPSFQEKNLSLELELAINIREREENWHERIYKVNAEKDKVIISSEKGSLIFASFPSGDFYWEEIYKEHYPKELQRCFIPGNYKINLTLAPKVKKDILFVFSCGENEAEALTNFENCKNTVISSLIEKEEKMESILSNSEISSNSNEIDELFKWSVISLEKLSFESDFGIGYFAGYPWFTQFWGRDLGWILPAVIDYGNFENAKYCLRILAKFQKDGLIPNLIYPNGKVDYNSADATPLWLIALHHYIYNSADIRFLFEMEENILKILEWYKQNADKNGFVDSDRTTWMDTLKRKKAVEIQVFWFKALKCIGDLLKLLGRSEMKSKVEKLAEKLEKNFEVHFWNKKENFYFDSINNNAKTINSIFPLIFDISKKYRVKKVLERIESEEFTTKFGVRTLSKDEVGYNPFSYHKGSSWGWIVGLVACAEFKANRPEKGFEYLKILHDKLNQNCLGAIDEAWNPEDDSNVLLKNKIWEESCCLQGWSSALVIRCVDEFILGLKINAFNKTIIASPSLLPNMKIMRRKRIGNDLVDLFFERKNNEVKINYKSRRNEEYKIILLPKI